MCLKENQKAWRVSAMAIEFETRQVLYYNVIKELNVKYVHHR